MISKWRKLKFCVSLSRKRWLLVELELLLVLSGLKITSAGRYMWHLSGIVAAFVHLAIAYFFLCAATVSF